MLTCFVEHHFLTQSYWTNIQIKQITYIEVKMHGCEFYNAVNFSSSWKWNPGIMGSKIITIILPNTASLHKLYTIATDVWLPWKRARQLRHVRGPLSVHTSWDICAVRLKRLSVLNSTDVVVNQKYGITCLWETLAGRYFIVLTKLCKT